MKKKTSQGMISQSTKIHLNLGWVVCHSDFYCDITLCLAIKIDTQLRSFLVLSEFDDRAELKFISTKDGLFATVISIVTSHFALAIKIDTHLRSFLVLCEIDDRAEL